MSIRDDITNILQSTRKQLLCQDAAKHTERIPVREELNQRPVTKRGPNQFRLPTEPGQNMNRTAEQLIAGNLVILLNS